MKRPIYLDFNATTPHAPEVIAAMRPFFEEQFGNPSSTHWYGIEPKRALQKARRQVADLLHCSPEEIVFTSGGTESNNHAIHGIVRALREKGNHIITTQIEHPAVLEVCRHLESSGVRTTYLPVDGNALVSVSDVERAIRPETILITIMHANNEVGTVQPISEISRVARDHGIVMHTDAAQSVGKIPTRVDELGVDLLSVAGHKVYAPKGVGALYIRKGIRVTPEPYQFGAGQEAGRRAGTENVMEVVGLGAACELAGRDLSETMNHLRKMRDRLYERLTKRLEHVRLNGHPHLRLPNTLSLSFYGVESDRILEEIGLEVAASAGAACHSGEVELSHVLEAMHVPEQWAKGTLRFSTGRLTTEAEIDTAVEVVSRAALKLSPAPA